MTLQPTQRFLRITHVISRVAAAAVFFTGLASLAYLKSRSADLARALHGVAEMKANTALGFVLCGVSLWLNSGRSPGFIARRVAQVLAVAVAAIGAVSLGEFLFKGPSWFDQWLIAGLESDSLPGRMSYLSALNFCFIGLGLLLIDVEPKRWPHAGHFFTLTAVLVCLLASIGYIFHFPSFYGSTSLFPGTQMARYTFRSFLTLSIGMFCARPVSGLMRVLTSDTDGGFILRRLVLIPVAVPMVTAAIPPILRHYHLTNMDIVGWLFSFANIFVFTMIFWWTASMLYRIDIKRHAAEDKLKLLNNELEQRIAERTAQLVMANRDLKGEVKERRLAEDEVRKLNASLEQRVTDRTAQIKTAYKELESFSYSVSHDLRAPLRAIGNYSAMLLEDNPQMPEQSRTYVASAQRNVKKMQQLIDDLLSFSRVNHQALQKHDVTLDEVARQCFAELQPEAAGRQINLTVRSNLKCHADPALVKQVLLNLLANAIKFTRHRETAMIEVGGLPPANGHVSPIFFVRDNGAGFDMKDATKLFGVFQRLHGETEYEGTGLGLAIVQNIVNRHGGRIWAEAEPDKGATFFFTLPD